MAYTPANCTPCPAGADCFNPFDRLVVSYLVRGGTRVMWDLRDDFYDEMPYEFQLQVGQSANPNADDWLDVGSPVTNLFFAVDGEQRIFGKIRWQFYRVKLTTAKGVYYSLPTGLQGTLRPYYWKLAKEIIRGHLVRMRNTHAGQLGYLLKRRVTGTKCPKCLDFQSEEITNPACQFCWGTGFLCGYFFPVDCVWADIDPKTVHLQQDSTRGSTGDCVVKALMINTWMLSEEDIWVNKVTDDRYYVHTVHNTAEMQGVPLVADVELRLIPATDAAYTIEIPHQLEGDL